MTRNEFGEWFRGYQDQCRWQAAQSDSPHEYTIRSWRPEADADFGHAVEGIRHFGYPDRFYDHTYTYFTLDGLKYWTMGSPVQETIVLNRAISLLGDLSVESQLEEPMKNDQFPDGFEPDADSLLSGGFDHDDEMDDERGCEEISDSLNRDGFPGGRSQPVNATNSVNFSNGVR